MGDFILLLKSSKNYLSVETLRVFVRQLIRAQKILFDVKHYSADKKMQIGHFLGLDFASTLRENSN